MQRDNGDLNKDSSLSAEPLQKNGKEKTDRPGTGETGAGENPGFLESRAFRALASLGAGILCRWKAFFASLVKKVGYTLAATGVIAVIAGLFCLILFLSLSAARTTRKVETGFGGPAPEEGAEADYDGMAPAAGTGDWSQAIPEQSQTEGPDSPLGDAFRGLFSRTREAASALRLQAENSIREEYLDILESGRGTEFEPEGQTQKELWEEVRTSRREKLEEDPFLILVNKWHYLPDDYQVEPVDLANGQQIGSLCYDKLMQMLSDCREAGGTPVVCSGYRPHEKQVWLYGAQVDRWLNMGYGQEEAEAMAATAVAIPGTSEHELGLAADIYSTENMDLDESQVNTFTQQWLMENCWRYGFILRYPKDKSAITGIIFEPWHYRYVGDDYAEKIHKEGLCLEEYLDQADHPYSPMDPFSE